MAHTHTRAKMRAQKRAPIHAHVDDMRQGQRVIVVPPGETPMSGHIMGWGGECPACGGPSFLVQLCATGEMVGVCLDGLRLPS